MFELCRASESERRRPLPGDDFVPHPAWSCLHAITIDAPPDQVWPWLVQMGAGRAGWYAYDRIDNGGTPSARRIIPELQQVAVGDLMPALPGLRDCFIVLRVIPVRALVLGMPLGAADATSDKQTAAPAQRVSWALVLEPLASGRTRLLARGRVSAGWLSDHQNRPVSAGSPAPIERVYQLMARVPLRFVFPVAGFGHYLMQARQLRGIKQRVEHGRRAETAGPSAVAPRMVPR
jgi:hypothetical protein